MRCKDMNWRGVRLAALGYVALAVAPAQAIDVKLSMDEAKKTLAAGRAPMEAAYKKAKPEERDQEVKRVLQAASTTYSVGADPVKDPCGARVILRTKRHWLESFGRTEARESEKQKHDVRMPDDKIQKYLDMPNLEVEAQLCGDDEYFAEGVQIEFRQGSKSIKPMDVSPADKGRKNEGQGPGYRSRFTARFAYDGFDPNAKTKVLITLQDGKMSEFEADFSKVK